MRPADGARPRICRNHPAAAAKWKCQSCGGMFCNECVVVKKTKFSECQSCPQCEGMCVTLAELKPPRRQSFLALLPGAFSYPLRKDGWLLLVLGAVFFLVLSILAWAPLVGWLISFFAGGYLCAYMMKIISSSANGDEEMPDWPAFRGFWDDILVPFFSVLIVVFYAFLPASIYVVVSAEGSFLDAFFGSPKGPVLPALFGCGLLYIPMALIALSIVGVRGALNPFLVTISILKVFFQYLLASLILGVLVGLRMASQTYIAGPIPFIGPVVDGLLSLYFLVVEMRILGLIYYANEERLGWFRAE